MNQDELLELIEKAAVEGWTELELGGWGLTELPPEITQLTNLKYLGLTGNILVTVPPEIWELTNLTFLDLNKNLLSIVPSEIEKLKHLTSLKLNNNPLTTIPSEIGQLSCLTLLDLSDNKLTAVPPEIGQLSSLTSLDLSFNKLTAVSSEIGQLSNLTSLNLMSNQLTAVPSEIGELTNLISLDLDFNELTSVPPEIGELTNLTSLGLSDNRLTAVPPEIGRMSSLTSLDLSDNQLTTVPPEIGNLTNLMSLYLMCNQLTGVPPEIGNLTNLRNLVLGDSAGGNKISELPPEIGQLVNLTLLQVNDNKLIAIPSEIKELTHLTTLSLWSNRLTAIPPEIKHLTALKKLHLNNNRLTVIPSEIGQLNRLTTLNLSVNQLSKLPDSLQELTQLAELDLRDNPALGISQEVLEQTNNPSLILQAYFGERRPLHEAKMLLVGQGGVGKTALTRRLLHNLPPNADQGKTEGVDIHKYHTTSLATRHSPPAAPITLNLWDFGGQGVYQATHQFFFTSRSLYLIVINARTGEQESRLRHWLNLVASLSDNAPAIIVINKQDEHALQLDERALKHKYPNLLDIIPTSCTTGAGIPALQEAIAAALTHLPRINDRFPVKWLALKKQLEAMDANYITYERYRTYCNDAGITDRHDQRSWGNVLHQLGVILNYQDGNFRQLEGTHVLKPEWVTDGVYRILSDPDQRIANNNGILTAAMLDHILDPDEYPRHQQAFIVGMMQKFELSFPLPNRQNQHLIPDLLPKEQPESSEAGLLTKAQLLDPSKAYIVTGVTSKGTTIPKMR